MATKRDKMPSKKVKNLPLKSASAKEGKGVRGGATETYLNYKFNTIFVTK